MLFRHVIRTARFIFLSHCHVISFLLSQSQTHANPYPKPSALPRFLTAFILTQGRVSVTRRSQEKRACDRLRAVTGARALRHLGVAFRPATPHLPPTSVPPPAPCSLQAPDTRMSPRCLGQVEVSAGGEDDRGQGSVIVNSYRNGQISYCRRMRTLDRFLPKSWCGHVCRREEKILFVTSWLLSHWGLQSDLCSVRLATEALLSAAI